jgi:hypothetical protein
MKGPVKPCDGRFSDELQAVLNRNRDRAQWANHTCEVCGLAVGAMQVRGKWLPEQHWPSVQYQSSKTTDQETGAENQLVKNSPKLAKAAR